MIAFFFPGGSHAIFSANSTGVYAGYPASAGGGGGGGDAPGGGDNSTKSMSIPAETASGTFSSDMGMPSGMPGGGDGGAGGMQSTALTANETFGRGGMATNDNGVVELVSPFFSSFHSKSHADILGC
jgi:hypothetical protein